MKDAGPTSSVERVAAALRRVEPRLQQVDIHSETSIVDDLGLDSLRFADLAIALEREFHIQEFPLQDWLDGETAAAAEGGVRFCVRSLADQCRRLAAESSIREARRR